MRALSIRQPYAELILRGARTIEYRSKPTRIIGEEFYIYAAKERKCWAAEVGCKGGKGEGGCSTCPCSVAPPEVDGCQLPRGVIVGTATISRCMGPMLLTSDQHPSPTVLYEWHLSDVKRLEQPRRPKRKPRPVWFRPF